MILSALAPFVLFCMMNCPTFDDQKQVAAFRFPHVEETIWDAAMRLAAPSSVKKESR